MILPKSWAFVQRAGLMHNSSNCMASRSYVLLSFAIPPSDKFSYNYVSSVLLPQSKVVMLTKLFNLTPLRAAELATQHPRLLTLGASRLAASQEMLSNVMQVSSVLGRFK